MGAKAQHSLAYRRLCDHLRQWRLEAGLTQRALAARLKVPHSFIYKIESRNRRIDPIEMCRWCNACKINPAAAIKVINQSV